MKKAFDMPKIVVEQFVPNEYVAACGEENKVYKFKCDAVGGSWLTEAGTVYLETNGEAGFQWSDTELGLYSHCGETHEADTTDSFLKGYIVNYRTTFIDDRRERPVCRSESPVNRPPAIIRNRFVIVTPGTAHRPFPTVFHGVNQIKHHLSDVADKHVLI